MSLTSTEKQKWYRKKFKINKVQYEDANKKTDYHVMKGW